MMACTYNFHLLNKVHILFGLVAFFVPTSQHVSILNETSSTIGPAPTNSSVSTSEESSTLTPFTSTISPRLEIGNCTLSTTNNSFAELKRLLSLNPAMVYVKLFFVDLEFESDTAYLNSTPNVIDPLSWTWVGEGKGYLLRRFSPNFLHLSLGTLSPDVYHSKLEISIEFCEEFQNFTDAAKYLVVSEFLIDAHFTAYEENSQNPSEFKVCQEFYHGMSVARGTFKAFILNLHVFIYLPDSIEIACWSSSDYTYQLQDNESFFWLSLMYYTILILGVLCFPFVIGIMIQRHPPKPDGQSFRFDRNTSLPIGLKYVLLFWRDNIPDSDDHDYKLNMFINFTRRTLLFSLLFFVSYWEAILLRLLDESYDHRVNSAFRFFINYEAYWAMTGVLIVLFIVYVIFMIALVVEGEELFLENQTQRKYFLFKKLPKGYYVPKARPDQPWQNRLFHYMSHRWQMAIDKRIIWDWLWKHTKLGKFISRGGYFTYLIKFPVSFLLMLLLIAFYCPLSYSLIMFVTWLDKDDEDGCTRCCIHFVFSLILLLLCFPFLIGVIRLVAGVAAMIADAVEYIFAGVLINIIVLDPIFFMILALLSYTIMTIYGFYDEYYHMNLILIVRARKFDERVSSKPPTSSRASISEDLFWYIVNDCQPIRIELVKSLLGLLVISFLAVIGFNVLEEVNAMDQLSDSATLIFSLIISLGVPIINATIHSGSSEDVRRQDLKRKIDKALRRYKKDNPDIIYFTKEPDELKQHKKQDAAENNTPKLNIQLPQINAAVELETDERDPSQTKV